MDKESNKIAKNFVNKIRKKFKINKIILFGSRARGDHFKDSDYDFIVIGDHFKGKPFIFRASEFYDYWNEKKDIEILCYTPEEFKRKSKEIGIVKQAIKEGIEIK